LACSKAVGVEISEGKERMSPTHWRYHNYLRNDALGNTANAASCEMTSGNTNAAMLLVSRVSCLDAAFLLVLLRTMCCYYRLILTVDWFVNDLFLLPTVLSVNPRLRIAVAGTACTMPGLDTSSSREDQSEWRDVMPSPCVAEFWESFIGKAEKSSDGKSALFSCIFAFFWREVWSVEWLGGGTKGGERTMYSWPPQLEIRGRSAGGDENYPSS
jgi:hypothetical protein